MVTEVALAAVFQVVNSNFVTDFETDYVGT
jgi:hypothetical protein